MQKGLKQACTSSKRLSASLVSMKSINTENNMSSPPLNHKHNRVCSCKCVSCAGTRKEGETVCMCAAYAPVCEVSETWCSCNLMRRMVCGECECISFHHQLPRARKWGLQPFTVWTNRPIKMKTWLPMRRSHSSRLQNRAVGTLQMEHEFFSMYE